MFDALWGWLFPIPGDGEPKQTFRWRQVVSLAILLIGGAVAIGDSLAWGFVPFLYPGFASAQQVKGVWTSLVEVRASQVERSILEARERQCNAILDGNMDVLQFATQRLNGSLDDYERVSKRIYRVPECSELVIRK
jgi:hypothetical protein